MLGYPSNSAERRQLYTTNIMIASPNQVTYATKHRNVRSHLYRHRMRYVGASVFFAILLAATSVSAMDMKEFQRKIAERREREKHGQTKIQDTKLTAEEEATVLASRRRQNESIAAKKQAKAEQRQGGVHLDRETMSPEEFNKISIMKLYHKKLEPSYENIEHWTSELRIDYYLEGQDEAVGRLHGHVNENEDLAKIDSVAVHTDWQGKPIYKRLYNAFMLYANTMLKGSLKEPRLKEVRLEAAGGFMAHYSYGFRTYVFKRPGDPWAKFEYKLDTTTHFSEKLNLAMKDCKAFGKARSVRCSLEEFLRQKVEQGEASNVPKLGLNGDCIWFQMKLQDPLTNPDSVIVKKHYSLAQTGTRFLLNCGLDASSIPMVLQDKGQWPDTGFYMNKIKFRRRLAALPERYSLAHPVNPPSCSLYSTHPHCPGCTRCA